MRGLSMTLSASLAAAFLSTGAAQAAPDYRLTWIDELQYVAAINNAGLVLGNQYLGSGGSQVGIFELGQSVRTIGGGLGDALYAIDLNNAGQALLTGWDESSFTPSFHVWDVASNTAVFSRTDSHGSHLNDSGVVLAYTTDSTMLVSASKTILLSQWGDEWGAETINNNGVIGGSIDDDSTDRSTPALWHSYDSPPVLLNLGGFADGYVAALNDSNVAVGTLYPEFFDPASPLLRGPVAAVWQDGELTLLNSGQFVSTGAFAINASGDIVGAAIAEWISLSAVLWQNDELIELNDYLSADDRAAGWMLESAEDINDNGWIVGNAHNATTGEYRAFLLSLPAVPEPASWGMMLAGLSAVVVLARRRMS